MTNRQKVRFDYLGGGVMMVYCDFGYFDAIAKLPGVTAVERAVSHLSVYVKVGYLVSETQEQIRKLIEGDEPERI